MMITWRDFIEFELKQPYMEALRETLHLERERFTVFPPTELVFNAMQQTALEKTKVVIIGQDPYHGPSQAMGLSFSVNKGCPLPPSLRNIYKEIERDLKVKMSSHGDLTAWAQQGVLLLNAILTVRQAEPLSHQNLGWQTFTDHLIEFVIKHCSPVAFLLWGKPAQQKVQNCLSHLDGASKTLILQAPHPSPLSAHRGFLGCGHFSTVNEWLIKQGQTPIEWKN